MAEKKSSQAKTAAPASDKKQAIQTAMSQIEKMYGKGSIMRLGDQMNAMNIEAISTGSLALDLALGIGGVPRGRIVEIYGPESSGKTTLALHILAQAQKQGGKVEQIAIAFNGETRTSFAEVQDLAAAIIEAAKEVIDSSYPLILVVEADIGKVLGNAVNVMLDYKKDVICIDGIKTISGDYVDIGEPVAEGHVVPVVIKTLIFNS